MKNYSIVVREQSSTRARIKCTTHLKSEASKFNHAFFLAVIIIKIAFEFGVSLKLLTEHTKESRFWLCIPSLAHQKPASNNLQHSPHLACKNVYVVPELQPSNTQPLHTMATSVHFSHKMFSHCPCLKGGFSTQSHWPAWEADCIAAGSALGTRPPGGKMPLRFIPAGAMAPVLHPNIGFEPLISDCAPL